MSLGGPRVASVASSYAQVNLISVAGVASARLKDNTGNLVEDSIGGGSTQGPAVVKIQPSDAAFQSINCETWTKIG
jgi:hypothetical protein